MSHSRCIVFMPMFVAVAASVRSATIARLDSSVFDHPARAMSHAWEAADIHPWETEQSDDDSVSDGMPNDQDVAAEELVNGLLELLSFEPDIRPTFLRSLLLGCSSRRPWRRFQVCV